MCELLKRSLNTAVALALALAFFVTGAMAQEPAFPAAAQCTAQASPGEVPAGEAAFRVTFNLSEGIGSVTGVQAAEGSGLALASPGDIPRAEMANPEEEARPIELAEANAVIVWLSTAGAQAGEYDLTLLGEGGACDATVTVR